MSYVFEEGVKEDLGSYGLVSPASALGEVVEHITLQSISEHMKDEVVSCSQQGFTKGK